MRCSLKVTDSKKELLIGTEQTGNAKSITAVLRAVATTLEQMDEEYQKNKDRERRELDRRC